MSGRTLTGVTHLVTTPDLIGRQLASPFRRIKAFAIDVAVLALPTILAAACFSALALYVTDRPAYDAIRALYAGEVKTDEDTSRVLTALLPKLIEVQSAGLPLEAITATKAGRPADGTVFLKDADFEFSLTFDGEDARPLKPHQVRVPIANFIPGTIRGFAMVLVPAVYFTLFGRFRGRTIGKRLMGLEVVRLDGHRLSWMESFDRFGGYAQIPGTFFIGLADLWRDPNHRLAHDRGAHTVVLRKL